MRYRIIGSRIVLLKPTFFLVASTYFANNEISSKATKSEPTAENGNDIINEDVILEQQGHISDSIETLSNEEKIERIK